MYFGNPIQARRQRKLEQAVTKEGAGVADRVAQWLLASNEPTVGIALALKPRRVDTANYADRLGQQVVGNLGEIGLDGYVEFDPEASVRQSLQSTRIGRPNSPAGWMPKLVDRPTAVFHRTA
jgi:hypothetical protein